jgi:hypothetical protein
MSSAGLLSDSQNLLPKAIITLAEQVWSQSVGRRLRTAWYASFEASHGNGITRKAMPKYRDGNLPDKSGCGGTDIRRFIDKTAPNRKSQPESYRYPGFSNFAVGRLGLRTGGHRFLTGIAHGAATPAYCFLLDLGLLVWVVAIKWRPARGQQPVAV